MKLQIVEMRAANIPQSSFLHHNEREKIFREKCKYLVDISAKLLLQ